jgi:hypothetical protein
MPFTTVTITHDFDLADGTLGTVTFEPVEPMHNGTRTVSAVKRAVLSSGGALSKAVEATTDPGTSPPGVPYRIVVRMTGQPSRTYYARVPHNQGSPIDLAVLLAWNTGTVGGTGGGGAGGGDTAGGIVGFGYAPVVLDASSGVISPDAALGYGPHRYTALADVVLAAPTGGTDGEPLEVQVKASAGDRTLSFPDGSSTVIAAGQRWWGRFSYDAVDDVWLLADLGGGTPVVAPAPGGSTFALAVVDAARVDIDTIAA